MRPNRSKYNVDISPAGKERRTRTAYDIVPSLVGIYDSEAEVLRADELSLCIRSGAIEHVERQIRVALTKTYAPAIDFRVRGFGKVWYEEVKGVRTRDFARLKREWQLYGPAPLLIYWFKGKGKPWKVERIEGKRQDDK